jgi:hypothetical protein
MVACHVGKTRKIQYVFSDRTFSSLSEVAKWGFSRLVRFFLNLLTNWTYDSSLAFIECNAYKVIGYDPYDEVIPFMASL